MSRSLPNPLVTGRIIFSQGDTTHTIIQEDLARGSRLLVREKFPEALQKAVPEQILDELEQQIFEEGNCLQGEIELSLEHGMQVIGGRYFSVITFVVKFPPTEKGGEPHIGKYSWIQWNSGAQPGAMALTVDQDGNIVLGRMFRHACRDYQCPGEKKAGWRLENSCGAKTQAESFEECALREAKEELGLVEASEVIELGVTEPDPGILRSRVPLFFIRGVFDSSNIDKDVSESEISIVRMSVSEFEKAVRSGQMIDARTAHAFLLARLRGLV